MLFQCMLPLRSYWQFYLKAILLFGGIIFGFLHCSDLFICYYIFFLSHCGSVTGHNPENFGTVVGSLVLQNKGINKFIFKLSKLVALATFHLQFL